jgi:disulfide oxidoreductase YuzD
MEDKLKKNHICATCKWKSETQHSIGCKNPSPDRAKFAEYHHVYEPCDIWEEPDMKQDKQAIEAIANQIRDIPIEPIFLVPDDEISTAQKRNREKLAKAILQTLTSLGYVKLADEQKLPENRHTIGGAYYMVRDAYSEAQQDMLNAGFRKVENSPQYTQG